MWRKETTLPLNPIRSSGDYLTPKIFRDLKNQRPSEMLGFVTKSLPQLAYAAGKFCPDSPFSRQRTRASFARVIPHRGRLAGAGALILA
jgi:hypothetical protein